MNYFQEQNQLKKTLNRFKKIRLYHVNGYNNLLPIKAFKKQSYNYQQIQLNTKFHFNAIIMDVDNEHLLTEWNHQGLPTPTIQTVNKHNNKAHLVWLLNVPVYKEHKHAVDYYKAIVNNIKELIGADPAYQNHQTKNFLNTNLYRVTYNDVAYDLGDFRRFITKSTPRYSSDEFDYLVAGSRHIHLFENLRRYGYIIANEDNLKAKLTQKAEHINQYFDAPIKVKYIVNSIYNFCEDNKHNFKNRNRTRAMKFEKIRNLSSEDYVKEVKKRQSKSAIRTSNLRKLKTSIKIKVAIEILIRHKTAIEISIKHKKTLTYKHIAKLADISVSTVRRNLKLINIFIQRSHGFIRSIRLIVQRAKRVCTKSLLGNNAQIDKKKSYFEYAFELFPPI